MTGTYKLSLSLLSLAFLVAAAPAPRPKPLPPYIVAYEPKTVDERGLWMEADEFESRLQQSHLMIRDENIANYVRRVLCETVGQDRCSAVRIYVLEIPAFNATMYPNGAMTVWTGLLLRVRSEAELGAVLGHEFAHFELRHSLQGFKQRRSASDAAAWIGLLGAMSNTDVSNTQWSLVGSVYTFNREQEQQADLLGMEYLRNSRYPALSASEVWKNIMAEADATAAGRSYKNRRRYSAGFFDSHPTDLARAAYLDKAGSATPDPGDEDVMGHQSAVSQLLQRMLTAQIKLNDFGGTEYILGELAKIKGWTGDLLFARAEMYRERGNLRDYVTAAQLYEQAIAAGNVSPEAYRGLGLALIKSGSPSEGKTALSKYLEKKPDSGDYKVIEMLVRQP